jgi:hypothetical protein
MVSIILQMTNSHCQVTNTITYNTGRHSTQSERESHRQYCPPYSKPVPMVPKSGGSCTCSALLACMECWHGE